MRDRGTPAECWTCARTRFAQEDLDALDVQGYLALGMSWELALETLGWAGTREDLEALADRVAVIRTALDTLAPKLGMPHGH